MQHIDGKLSSRRVNGSYNMSFTGMRAGHLAKSKFSFTDFSDLERSTFLQQSNAQEGIFVHLNTSIDQVTV